MDMGKVVTHQLQALVQTAAVDLLPMATRQWQVLGESTAAMAIQCLQHRKQQELGGRQVCLNTIKDLWRLTPTAM
jgi:hypothetical protein